ncbi:primosomal protein N' (replication factor Y) [Pseudochelatococcus contaminans]|uniref:Replication restart protein PriA n=2 Tax=Pseudochelatococcus contaminans TaxID=1538103 RepID=A0A7W6EEF3_9HYPH|nr:primosomal protein N' [Pseudochelatococcus contaminans]MBB3808203.1 primosomal protein N' (replication factor Y) [Pseudochelatococcus contaminans]
MSTCMNLFADIPSPDDDAPALVAEVLLPVALDKAYSYLVPAGMALGEGDVVLVPLAKRQTAGVVWALRGVDGAGSNLRSVIGRIDVPPFGKSLRDFLDWIAWYTLAPRGLAMKLALRVPEGAGPDESRMLEPPRIGVRIAGEAPRRMTPARGRVLAALADGHMLLKRDLAHEAGVSASVVDGLLDEGTLEAVALPPMPVVLPPDPDFSRAGLSEAQHEAAAALAAQVRDARFSVTLVEGVTGSGKTEVYFEAVAEALRAGKQALILMPEIALTSQFLARFEARFGARPAEWHSGITGRKRARIHAGTADGSVRVVAGARSALFMPFRDLALIVVDEEHETAYKQDDGVTYHARDMAVVRGRFDDAAVVLASATPSIESKVNAIKGRYRHLVLPERFGGRQLPSIKAIDLRRHPAERGRWISPPLVAAVNDTMAAGEQALLFLNRRGYAPLTLCRHCGHRFQCPNCSAWLVDHRFRRALVCHHCGHVERRPDICPSCHATDTLAACGPGVERLAEEVAEVFPDKRAIVLSSDFPGGAERIRAELQSIADGEVDIVIGTQLVAKGHNFPGLTLVGVVDADIGLSNGDPRAAERTFQLMQQVTGRAGRGEKPGRALIQTMQPDHPVLRAIVSGDAQRFYAEEIAMREEAGLPPFGKLAALIVSSPDRAEAENHARALARVAQAPSNVAVLGPAEAPLALVRGRYRFRLLVRAERGVDMQGYLRDWLSRAPKHPAKVRVAVDVDPQSFM